MNLVSAHRGDDFILGVEREIGDAKDVGAADGTALRRVVGLIEMTAVRDQFAAVSEVPDLRRAVARGRREASPVRAVGERVDAIGVAHPRFAQYAHDVLGKTGRQIGKLPPGIAEVASRGFRVILKGSLTALGEFIGTSECFGRESGLHRLFALREKSLPEGFGIRDRRPRLSPGRRYHLSEPGDDGARRVNCLRSTNVMTGLAAESDDY